MPRNKTESLIFTLIMCLLMVCGMSSYNLLLSGGFTAFNFFVGLLPGVVFAFFIDMFVVGPVAKKVAFSLPIDKSNRLKMILAISVCMILGMVTFMSLFGMFISPEAKGNSFILTYLNAWKMNLLAALPLQLLIVGPLSRFNLQLIQNYFDNRMGN